MERNMKPPQRNSFFIVHSVPHGNSHVFWNRQIRFRVFVLPNSYYVISLPVCRPAFTRGHVIHVRQFALVRRNLAYLLRFQKVRKQSEGGLETTSYAAVPWVRLRFRPFPPVHDESVSLELNQHVLAFV